MTLQFGLFGEDPAPRSRRMSAIRAVDVDAGLVEVARRVPPNVRLGTSSWTYPGWAGLTFAVTGSTAPSMAALAYDGLAAYAAHPLLRTVGVDRTYYQLLPFETFSRYASLVPEDFRFLVKAHQELTFTRLSMVAGRTRFLDVGFAREMIEAAIEGLGAKLGVFLIQFSPMRLQEAGGASALIDGLGAMLAALRTMVARPIVAVELRNPELFAESALSRYLDALRLGDAVHCYNVHPNALELSAQCAAIPPQTQRAIIVRWMLRRNHRYEAAAEFYKPFDRLVEPDEPSRQAVADLVRLATRLGREAWVIAGNKAEGSSPCTLVELARIVGQG